MLHRKNSYLVKRFVLLAVTLVIAGCAAQVHHHAGLAAMDAADYPKAVAELQAAADLEPLDVEYKRDWLKNRDLATNKLLAQAAAAAGKGKSKEAADFYRTILKYDPTNARANAGLAEIAAAGRAGEDVNQAKDAVKRGESERARRLVQQALDRSPGFQPALQLRNEIENAEPRTIPEALALAPLYRKPINLDFRDASVKMVFDSLSRTTGINFILDRDIKADQRTTVVLKQTSLDDAIEVLLTTNQLEKRVLNPTSVLIYPNTAAKNKEYQNLAVRAFYLSNIDARTAANLLKSVLKIKEVYVDEKYHMLVLRESPDTIALAEKLIELQDLEEPEVMLEVEVLEVNRNRLLNLGVQLSNQLTISPLSKSGLNGGATGSGSPSYKLSDLLHLNADTLGVTLPSATLSLQRTVGDANLLANPRLRVRDREKARILIGDKVPVVTTTTTPNGFLSENIQYLDVGLKLEVEPEVHLRDDIGMKLSLEVSSLVNTIKTPNGSQAFQIGTRNISTSLRVRDGETQVLAGLISNADRSDANRIPLGGDLPMIGRLFSSQKDDHQKTEIVMSITPHLIRNIQRKSLASETFWSGTETSLRAGPAHGGLPDTPKAIAAGGKPIGAQSLMAPAMPTAALGYGVAAAAAPNDVSGVVLRWDMPAAARVGEPFTAVLTLDTRLELRAAPLQLAFNPKAYELVSVQSGDFFKNTGSQFSQSVDKISGRVSVAVSAQDGKSASGRGTVLSLVLKPISANEDGSIELVGFTPIGAKQAIDQPALPRSTPIRIEP